MLTWLKCLCPKNQRAPAPAPARYQLTAAPDDVGPADTPPKAPSAPAQPADTGGHCGWFDSSLDLRQGLAVSELAEPDWTVMVLWFGPAAQRRSACLH